MEFDNTVVSLVGHAHGIVAKTVYKTARVSFLSYKTRYCAGYPGAPWKFDAPSYGFSWILPC